MNLCVAYFSKENQMYNSLKNINFVKSYPHFIHMGGKICTPVGGKICTLNYLKFFVKKCACACASRHATLFIKNFWKFPFLKKGESCKQGQPYAILKKSSLFWRLRPRRVFIPCLARDLT